MLIYGRMQVYIYAPRAQDMDHRKKTHLVHKPAETAAALNKKNEVAALRKKHVPVDAAVHKHREEQRMLGLYERLERL